MGREINERQKESRWGSGFLAQLSKDLMAEFPDMKGFSRSNLQHIRSFYAFYVGVNPICEQVAHKLVPDVSNGICGQAARKLEIFANDDTTSNAVCSIPEEVFRIPWWHHIILMRKCKTPQEALFYVHKTIEGNWSRSVLLNMLDTGLYEANGQAITYLPVDGLTATAVGTFSTIHAGFDRDEETIVDGLLDLSCEVDEAVEIVA